MTPVRDAPGSAAPIDGRRRRTRDSRARIVSAMLDLTQEGHVSAGAELVARRAQVGLRTVFRHFTDMDSLYREMSLAIEARLGDGVTPAFASSAWRDRIGELIERRAAVFEAITPLKRAEAAHRHRSEAIGQDIARMNRRFREILAGVLPRSIARDPIVFEALDMTLSFETWDRLRREQHLKPGRAREILETLVAKLLADVEAK